MDFFKDEVDKFIEMPKFIALGGNKTEKIRLSIGNNIKYQLLSEEGEYEFLLEINQSKKRSIKINLHFQEDDYKIGLLRVDYNGVHTNPQTINEYVPLHVQQFIGKKFSLTEHHMHIHVQGYPSLAWAIPLVNVDFPIKEVIDSSSFTEAILAFTQKINLKTEIMIEQRLL